MTIHSIDRISLPDRDTFFREYVSKQRPVVITDLFAGEPIRQVRTLRDATEMFGNTQLLTRNEYISARNTAEMQATSVMTFKEYWAHVHQDPASVLLCTEYPIPARIMTQFKLPVVCLAAGPASAEILDFPKRYGDHDLFGNVFIAGRGNKAHIHYDGDQRQVLLYQVFGRKEVILLPPASGAPFKPLDQYNLDLFFDRMSPEEKLRIIDEGNGYHTVINPGEAIYMPMLIWHYLAYVDDGMSFNLRFGRNKYGRFLCVENFHRDYYVQNVCALLGDTVFAETGFAAGIEAITALYQKPAVDLPSKILEMRQLFRELCQQFCPDARVDPVDPQSEAGHLREILRDVSGRMPYLSPAAVKQMRPQGPIAPAQRALINEKAGDAGYSAEQLSHIMFNCTGKSSVDTLTKAEAVQMLSYFASPGAQW